MLSISRWRAHHLLAAWGVYWVLLAIVALGHPALLAWHVSGLAPGHSSASFNFGNDGFSGNMIEDGRTIWSAAIGLTALTLWIVLPPLLLWLLWLARRPAPATRPPELPGPGVPFSEAPARDAVRERTR
jgi:hypothetical protein